MCTFMVVHGTHRPLSDCEAWLAAVKASQFPSLQPSLHFQYHLQLASRVTGVCSTTAEPRGMAQLC
jgi:hypothetical protein